MILEKQTEAHILQEGQANETIGMSLDLDSAQVLMQMLSKNLYSDAIGSTIRECASNALDSHRRAGIDTPIIVSFKTSDRSDTFEFSVEDFGIGLDADDVKNIISKYGKSTKRNSNTELGMMGLGFKAPLAYSSSFYFVARKDGVERKYMMYEGEDVNSIDLLYETPTTEPNGVKVIVPVAYSDRYSFGKKIKEQLAYFESVYFDVNIYGTSISIDNDFKIYRSEHFQFSSLATNDYMHLCLDNVSYPIDWEKLGVERIGIPIALRFSLSDGLFPTPNREAIRYTQEAKKTILAKLAKVADIFMTKFNESITGEVDISSVFEFYQNKTKAIQAFYRSDINRVYIGELLKYATVPMTKPKVAGIKLLDLEYVTNYLKGYLFSEYRMHSMYQGNNNRFSEIKINSYYHELTINRFSDSDFGGIYIYSDSFTKGKKDYMRTILGDRKTFYFLKKHHSYTLGDKDSDDYSKTYHAVLKLRNHPKSDWRQLIQDYQYIISLFTNQFINLDAIEIPQVWIDEQKAKRMKISANPITVNGVKKVRMKGEFSGKVGTKTEMNLTDQYAKFVPTTYKMEDIHKVYKLHVYAKEIDKKTMDKHWSVFNGHVVFVIVAQATYDNLQKAELHNWITIDKFMEGKNRPFKTMATELLIERLVRDKKSTFDRINIVGCVSLDLADKLTMLNEFNIKYARPYADSTTKNIIIEHAIENNLFDQEVYMIYKQVNEVFEKLPFLNDMLGLMNYTYKSEAPILKALVDLFKYHKHKVNLELYKLTLTEDVPLQETLTQDTVEELQTI